MSTSPVWPRQQKVSRLTGRTLGGLIEVLQPVIFDTDWIWGVLSRHSDPVHLLCRISLAQSEGKGSLRGGNQGNPAEDRFGTGVHPADMFFCELFCSALASTENIREANTWENSHVSFVALILLENIQTFYEGGSPPSEIDEWLASLLLRLSSLWPQKYSDQSTCKAKLPEDLQVSALIDIWSSM